MYSTERNVLRHCQRVCRSKGPKEETDAQSTLNNSSSPARLDILLIDRYLHLQRRLANPHWLSLIEYVATSLTEAACTVQKAVRAATRQHTFDENGSSTCISSNLHKNCVAGSSSGEDSVDTVSTATTTTANVASAVAPLSVDAVCAAHGVNAGGIMDECFYAVQSLAMFRRTFQVQPDLYGAVLARTRGNIVPAPPVRNLHGDQQQHQTASVNSLAELLPELRHLLSSFEPKVDTVSCGMSVSNTGTCFCEVVITLCHIFGVSHEESPVERLFVFSRYICGDAAVVGRRIDHLRFLQGDCDHDVHWKGEAHVGYVPTVYRCLGVVGEIVYSHFLIVHQAVKDGSSLPHCWRSFLGMLGAARFSAEGVIRFEAVNFLRMGGDVTWLTDASVVPTKLKRVQPLNRLLAHAPWRIPPACFKELMGGTNPWTATELCEAILILSEYHTAAACEWLFGMNAAVSLGLRVVRSDEVTSSFDMFKKRKYDPPPMRILCGETAKVTFADRTVALLGMFPEGGDWDSVDPEIQKQLFTRHRLTEEETLVLKRVMVDEPARRSPLSKYLRSRVLGWCVFSNTLICPPSGETSTTSRAHCADCLALYCGESRCAELRCGGRESSSESKKSRSEDSSDGARRCGADAVTTATHDQELLLYSDDGIEYADFHMRSENYQVSDERALLDACLMVLECAHQPALAPLLKQQTEFLLNFSDRRVKNQLYPTTQPLRIAIWNYVQMLYGFLDDTYSYQAMNNFLSVRLKIIIKKLVCYPQRITRDDIFCLEDTFCTGDVMHLCTIALQSRRIVTLNSCLCAFSKAMLAL
eukprot:Lankesteria_metandrocarpae@DN3481_c0_g1_i2.p1